MDALFIGLFTFFLGIVLGRRPTPVRRQTFDDLSYPVQELVIFQHVFYTLQQLKVKRILPEAKVEHLLQDYYQQNGPVQAYLEHREMPPTNHTPGFYQRQVKYVLTHLQSRGELTSDELENCIAYLNSGNQTATAAATAAVPPLTEPVAPIPNPVTTPPAPQPPPGDSLSRWFNRIEYFFNTGKSNWITFLGVILVVFSSIPIIQNLSSATTVYVVLLAYSIGLFGAGYGIWRFYPWTGQVFYLVTLLIIPMDFMSITGLDMSEVTDIAVMLVAFISLSAIAYATLKRLLTQLPRFYFISLIALGICAAFMKDVEALVVALGGNRLHFEYVVLVVPLFFLLLGVFQQNRLLQISEHRHNLPEVLWPNALLTYAWLLCPAVNNISGFRLGSGGMFLSLAFFLTAWQIRNHLNSQLGPVWPPHYFRMVLEIELCAYILSLAGLGATFRDYQALLVSLVCLTPLYAILSWHWRKHWFRWILYGLTASCVGTGLYFGTLTWTSDAQSLLMAAVTLSLMVLGYKSWQNHPQVAHWWQESWAYTSVLASVGTWVMLGQFEEWSSQTLWAMALTTALYVLFAIYQKRNVFGYLAVGTGILTAFSVLSVWHPLMEFESYRYYALAFSYGLLGLGYTIQRGTPHQTITVATQVKASEKNWKSWLTSDMIQPFHFQQRFKAPWPYLFAEPMYNLSLLMASVALLFELGDYTIAIAAMSFYGLIFLIYPSRIWLYFVITAATDGVLGLITDVLPDKYHNLGLVFLSMGWFFVGIMVEELLSAHDRKNPEPAKQQKQRLYAQPFFHGAIFANLLLLRYYFGDLQSVFTEEGWNKMTQEMVPVLLTSFFYVLKIRVYVSKLWLYPGIITGTLGIYFGLTSLFPVEYPLLIMTTIAWLWLGMGQLVNSHPGIQQYLREMIRHRLPDLQTNSRFYRIHVADFASPFYTFALLVSLMMVLFSTVLIPQQSALFNREFEFALTRAHPATLYVVQSLTFALLTLFFVLYSPRYQPLLEGDVVHPEKPWQMDYLPLITGCLGLLWLFSEHLTRTNLPLILGSLALAGLAMAVRIRQTRTHQAILYTAHTLGGLMWLLIMSRNGMENLFVLGLLGILYAGSLFLTRQPVWLYLFWFTAVVEGIAVTSMMPDLGWLFKMVPLGLLVLAWMGWHGLKKSQAELESHWQYTILALAVLAGLSVWPQLVDIFQVVQNGAYNPSIYPFSVSVKWENTIFTGFTYLSLYLAVLLVIHRRLEARLGWGWFVAVTFALWGLFLGLCYPWLMPVLIMGMTVIFEVIHKGQWPHSLALTEKPLRLVARCSPFVYAFMIFWIPARAPATESGLRYSFSEEHWYWLFAVYFVAAVHMALVAYQEKNNRYWYGAAVLFQWPWIGLTLRWLRIDHDYDSWLIGQAIFLEISLCLVLLGMYTITKPKERSQLIYVGLTLPLMTWLFQFWGAMFPNFHTGYTPDYRRFILFVLLEITLFLWGCIQLGIKLKQRPFLYFGITMTSLMLLGGFLALLIAGNWLVRWSVFIGTGGLLIVMGTLFQAKNQQMLETISGFYQEVTTWAE